jgi:hypothetical protein
MALDSNRLLLLMLLACEAVVLLLMLSQGLLLPPRALHVPPVETVPDLLPPLPVDTFCPLRATAVPFAPFLYLAVRFAYRILVNSRVMVACSNSCTLFTSQVKSILSSCLLDNPNMSWAKELKSMPLHTQILSKHGVLRAVREGFAVLHQ